MEEFQNLKSMKKFKINYNKKHSYLNINNPHLLVRFSGYLKLENNGSKVLFRGQTKDYYGTMIPALFRGDNIKEKILKHRYDAYNYLLRNLKSDTKLDRFHKKNDGAILQHYGIKTPWLDLVDNLYTAIWFATMERTEKEPFKFVERKNGEFGWIYFIKVKERSDPKLKFCELREEHSSLSLRLHTQHGIAVRRKDEPWKLPCLKKFVVGTVKFRINDEWKLKGHLFDAKFMFPSILYDRTYNYLKKDQFSNLINETKNNFHLSDMELGKIDNYDSA